MKRIAGVGIVLVSAIAALGAVNCAFEFSRYRTAERRAKSLRPGMTVAEVKAILGAPLEATVQGDKQGRLIVVMTYAKLWAASHDVAVSFYSGRDSLSATIWDGPGWFGDPPP